MKLPKIPAPEALTAVEAGERLVAEREDELARIETDISSAEAALPDLASQDDDELFEATSLKIERLRRSELRAQKRLEQAREALVEAERGEEQGRRRVLFAAGQKAASEADKLAQAYAGHAAAIADTPRAIDKLRAPIEAANADLPAGEGEIGTHAFHINERVELPAATVDGEKFWYRPDGFGYGPLNPRPAPQIFRQPVFANGRWILSDDEDYEAAVAAEKSKPAALGPLAQRSAPSPSKYGDRTLPDGTRITLPPNQWPLRQEAN